MSRQPASHDRGSAARTREAFTLIEVLVALGLVLALMAVSVPVLLLSFGERQLEAEAESLAAAMSGFRAEAARERKSLALKIEPAEGSWGGSLHLTTLSDLDRDTGVRRDAAAGQGLDTQHGKLLYRASRPFTITVEPPVRQDGVLTAADFRSPGLAGAMAGGAERTRVAAVSASGQMLATRPLWIHNGERMVRLQIGMASGAAMLEGARLIPDEADPRDLGHDDDRPDPDFGGIDDFDGPEGM
ncbi:MAG: hypothetical protein ACNA8P_07585 [Phycisphaerales bacterium]